MSHFISCTKEPNALLLRTNLDHPSIHPSILCTLIIHKVSGSLESVSDDLGYKAGYTLDPFTHCRQVKDATPPITQVFGLGKEAGVPWGNPLRRTSNSQPYEYTYVHRLATEFSECSYLPLYTVRQYRVSRFFLFPFIMGKPDQSLICANCILYALNRDALEYFFTHEASLKHGLS